MGQFTDEVKRRARLDIRYARGMECMQRERYLECLKDLRAARQRGDLTRAHEIIEDLGAFARETVVLMQQRQRVYERCVAVGMAPSSPRRFSARNETQQPAPVIAFRPQIAKVDISPPPDQPEAGCESAWDEAARES